MSNKIGRVLQTRHLAQAAAKHAESSTFLRPENIRTTKLANGLSIVSVENYSPITRFGVLVRAGARYEPADQLGISHALRLAAGYSTRKSTIFGITRNIEHLGGQLTASTNRENIIYQLHNNRDHNEQTLQYLADTVTRPAFKPWELDDYKYRFTVELDRLQLDLQARLFEALHKAAFRGGLSNSLYSPEFNVGKHTSEKLHEYVRNTFQPNRTVVAAVGADHEQLVKFVESNFEFGPVLSPPEGPVSKFVSGDVRIEAAGPLTFAAVVGEAPAATNLKESLAIGVLGQVLGSGPRITYSSGGNRLAAAASKVAKHPFHVSTFAAKYSDVGIFGIHTISNGSEAGDVIKSAVSELRNTIKNLSDADVQKAKYVFLVIYYIIL